MTSLSLTFSRCFKMFLGIFFCFSISGERIGWRWNIKNNPIRPHQVQWWWYKKKHIFLRPRSEILWLQNKINITSFFSDRILSSHILPKSNRTSILFNHTEGDMDQGEILINVFNYLRWSRQFVSLAQSEGVYQLFTGEEIVLKEPNAYNFFPFQNAPFDPSRSDASNKKQNGKGSFCTFSPPLLTNRKSYCQCRVLCQPAFSIASSESQMGYCSPTVGEQSIERPQSDAPPSRSSFSRNSNRSQPIRQRSKRCLGLLEQKVQFGCCAWWNFDGIKWVVEKQLKTISLEWKPLQHDIFEDCRQELRRLLGSSRMGLISIPSAKISPGLRIGGVLPQRRRLEMILSLSCLSIMTRSNFSPTTWRGT